MSTIVTVNTTGNNFLVKITILHIQAEINYTSCANSKFAFAKMNPDHTHQWKSADYNNSLPKSLRKTNKNRKGPKTEPWGTPLETVLISSWKVATVSNEDAANKQRGS